MSAVLETLEEYNTYIKFERRLKPSTIRKVNLSLSYFTELFGITDTKDLQASDVYMFYEWLKNRYCLRTKNSEQRRFGDAFLQKIMTHTKSYIKRLSEKGYLNKLVPADVPRGKVKGKIPTFLTKNELGKMVSHLEKMVAQEDMF